MQKINAAESSAAESRSPLLEPDLLKNVLSYVGPGHCLFVAPVSNLWKHWYAELYIRRVTEHDELNCKRIVTCRCVSKRTQFSSVFASPSRAQLALESGLDSTSKACQRAAGEHADIATLATAHSLGMQFTASTLAGAAQYNKLAAVQYLHSPGCPWPYSGVLENAAKDGHFELLRWGYDNGCTWGSAARASECAAYSGNVELMAWVLQQPGVQLNAMAMCRAAEHGHTELCQYLHAQQCPWNYGSTTVAAQNGHIDLLRWLIDNGCPYAAGDLCYAAAELGSAELLEYLQQQGITAETAEGILVTDVLDIVGLRNKLSAALWL
jgi:Ankyrin repeats (3 copies)